jgi:hypothetical protein
MGLNIGCITALRLEGVANELRLDEHHQLLKLLWTGLTRPKRAKRAVGNPPARETADGVKGVSSRNLLQQERPVRKYGSGRYCRDRGAPTASSATVEEKCPDSVHSRTRKSA